MTSNLFFYQLLLVALVLMCLMMHVWGPDHPTPTPRTSLKPSKPRRKRSKEPKPFTGYSHKPLCEACQQGVDSRPKAPGSPPPVMIFTRGRRRTVDTSGQFCPDYDCSYHGWLGRGNIRSNGRPGGQRWRQFQLNLSRLNHWLPRSQPDPEVVQSTAEFHHQIADALFPQADAIFHNATALHATVDMLNPQPTLVQRLVRPLLRRREILTTWLLGRHEDLHLGQREGQEAQILQQPAPSR